MNGKGNLMHMTYRALLMAAVMASSALGEMRTWTSAVGTTLDAEYVRSDAQSVVLRRADGQELQVRLHSLSDEDRAFVRAQQPPPTLILDSLSREEASRDDSMKLSDEAIAALKTEVEVRPGERLVFAGAFGPQRLTAQDLRRLRPDSPIPYRITADFFAVNQRAGGRSSRRRVSTRVQFYLLDAQGNVLLHRSEPIASLCPT